VILPSVLIRPFYTEKEIGLFYVDDFANENGRIRARDFIGKFNAEVR